jgi:hypothetical protein
MFSLAESGYVGGGGGGKNTVTNIRGGTFAVGHSSSGGSGSGSNSPRLGANTHTPTLKHTHSTSLTTTLSPAFLERLQAVVTESQTKFIACVWGALATHTSDSTLVLEYQKNTHPPTLTFDSGRLVKAKFSSFNSALEEIYTHQKPFSVPDPVLRGRLREEGKKVLLPVYGALYEKFEKTQFSKKHMSEYLKFPPATVASMIEELYSG